MNCNTAIALLLLAGIPRPVAAQGSAGSSGRLEPRYLIDLPTAGMLDKGSLAVDIDFYQKGGALLALSVGVLDRLSFGIGYGGTGLIGTETPVMNEVPGVNVKIRLIEEGIVLPALVIGFDSQGKDGYIKSLSRYVIKSPGLYIAASKNYSMLGFLSVHGGVNYTFERADDDRDANGYLGLEKTIGPFISAVVEYNLGNNDNSGNALGRGRGYMSGALKCSIGGGLTLGIHLKDILKNGSDASSINRTVHIEYAMAF